MGTLLLKLHHGADHDADEEENLNSHDDYYFRENTNNGTIQVLISVILDGEAKPIGATAHHLNRQGMWFRLFATITPESTDKFTWTGNDEMSAADALAESIAKSAFALLR